MWFSLSIYVCGFLNARIARHRAVESFVMGGEDVHMYFDDDVYIYIEFPSNSSLVKAPVTSEFGNVNRKRFSIRIEK